MANRDLPAHIYRKPAGLYFQRRGWTTVRLRSQPGTPAFAVEYALILNGALRAPPKRTFAALVAHYRQSPRYARLAPRTARDYDRVLDWVTGAIGDVPVDAFTRQDVLRARDSHAATVRFANYIVQVMRILLEHAVDLGWRPDNPARGVGLLHAGADPRQAWPADKIAAYRQAASGRALLIFELCLGTGQRIGDVLAMRWSDIDGDGIRVRQNKTGVEVWVPFTPHLRATLDATPKLGPTICAWGLGKPTSYRGAADLVMAVRRRIGAEDYDIHGLRYSAACELAELGCRDEVIAAIIGHATIAMVQKYSAAARMKRHAVEAQARR